MGVCIHQRKEDAAVELVKNLFKSLKIYYNNLFNTGYKKYSDVNKLLVFDFITELLTGDMRIYINEDDYRIIQKALNCLYGSSCLIPYPTYLNNNNLFGNVFSNSMIVRATEVGNIVRISEDAQIRIKM